MPPVTPTGKQLAKRLIDRKRSAVDEGMSRAAAAALAADELYQALSRWIGSEGCYALMARARAEAQADHPELEALQLRDRAGPNLYDLSVSFAEHGESATSDAIQAMLGGMIDQLGRLIGADLAANLIERSLAESASELPGTEKRSAQA